MTPLRRFQDKAVYHPETGCWVWSAAKGGNGYGRFGSGGKVHVAHRWHYEQMVGEVPVGLDLDHLCRNRACVNLDHIEPVTRSENLRRSKPFLRNARSVGLACRKFPYPEGVTHDKRRGAYFAQARVNGKTLYLGSSKTIEGAARLYKEYRAKTEN